MGVGTGWTVFKQKPCLNSILCGKILQKKSSLNKIYTFNRFTYDLDSNILYLPIKRQSAWNVIHKNKFSSVTSGNSSNIKSISLEQHTFHQRLNMERYHEDFLQWLVGMTDGDGCFSVYYKNNKVNFIYKISLSTYNIRALLYIKNKLGVGSISLDKKNSMGSFIIRDLNTFENIIFPIFDKYPLLTSKYFNYQCLKNVYNIIKRVDLNQHEKKYYIDNIWKLKPELDYISPAWKNITLPFKDSLQVKKVISKSWLVGFVEAEASFYITLKEKNRNVHGFGITQKLDSFILEGIRHILHIKSKVRLRKPLKGNNYYYILDTTGKRSIKNICNYFEGNLKTIKSLEFRIWKKAFLFLEKETKTNEEKKAFLLKTQKFLRKLRKKRPNYNLFKK